MNLLLLVHVRIRPSTHPSSHPRFLFISLSPTHTIRRPCLHAFSRRETLHTADGAAWSREASDYRRRVESNGSEEQRSILAQRKDVDAGLMDREAVGEEPWAWHSDVSRRGEASRICGGAARGAVCFDGVKWRKQ